MGKGKLKICCLLTMLVVSGQVVAQSSESKTAFANYHKYYHPQVNQPEKEKTINTLREYYANSNEVRDHLKSLQIDWKRCIGLIRPDGAFIDLIAKEKTEPTIAAEAYKRLWLIADAAKRGLINEKDALTVSYLNSIIYYGNIEINRPNIWSRFHASCFAIPTAVANIYFCFLKQMDAVENGENKNQLLKQACDMLKVVALQAWTQPFRNDTTDNNVVQIERFRHNVWWVGGNGLGGWGGYRAVLPVAAMYRSVPMVDVLAEASLNAISNTAQITNQADFWTEGLTADGAGWGHGRQSLVWGYPIHGTAGALSILSRLKGTPFNKTLGKVNIEALMNYFRGANFYYYKGYILPCLDRGSMSYNTASNQVPYLGLINMLMNNWGNSLSNTDREELRELKIEAEAKDIRMQKYPAGMYSGTRWFYNNDDLIKKSDDYHVIVNMASKRCDGIESATNFADSYNFYTADGLTLFQRKGNEYKTIYGAFDVTASPGVTAREGMDNLVPVTNWRGYNSKYNFAGAATSGGANSAAGFIFEKQNASDRPNVNDKANNIGRNEMLYGVKAYKSWFIVGDYLVALGAGVTNNKPNLPGNIRTTIDQTAMENEIIMIKNGKELPISTKTGVVTEDKQPIWIKQRNKFAYTLLPEISKKLWYACETKKTDWPKMNAGNKGKSNLTDSVNILRIWIDHGQKPVNDSYGYVVYMGKEDPATEVPVTVASNDTTLQAVQSKDEKVIGAVFYSPKAILKFGNNSLKVSAPCAVLIEKGNKGSAVTVTDAEMNNQLKEIIVTFNRKRISFAMPQGKECGKPVSQNITWW